MNDAAKILFFLSFHHAFSEINKQRPANLEINWVAPDK
jgi:hypothetical protein